MSEPLVAIITRTRDRVLFLSRAVESVLAQKERDWVHFIINDGGDAPAVDALVSKNGARYAGRVKVIHNERSLGRPGAANVGLRAARSQLIVFHDDDDTWSPEFLSRTVATWRRTGAKGVVSRAEELIERLEGDRLVTVRKLPFFPDLSVLSFAALARNNCIVNLAFLFEREALEVVGLLDERLPVYDDWDFNLRFLYRFDVEVVPEVLAWYHRREVAAGSAQNSFVADASKVAAARGQVVNRWLRNPDTQAVGLLLAIGPSLDAVDDLRQRLDKLFNLLHGVRHQWPLKQLESWLTRSER